MEREPSSPASRTGGLAALGGSMLVASSMFMPWVDTGPSKGADYWHLASVEGVRGDRGIYEVSLVLMLALVAWCALFFVWRSHESRVAWAFGGFAGAAMLYGGDLALTADLPPSAYGSGEIVAAIGLFVLLLGCLVAVVGNVAEPHGAPQPSLKGR